MKPGEFWTHSAFRDVFIEIVTVQYRGPHYWKVKVNWWHILDYQLGVIQVIKIKTSDLKQWKIMNEKKKNDG